MCSLSAAALDYAFSLEGALKLKEISYIHAEAYAAGELKHGTIALITDHVPVIAIATQKHIFAKTISNIREVKARGAYVVLLVTEDTAVDEGIADVIIRIPKEDDKIHPYSPIAVVLQLIAYYASVQKGLDVDQPRKSCEICDGGIITKFIFNIIRGCRISKYFCWAAALLYAQMVSKSVTFSMPFFINAVHSSRFQYRLDTFCASHRHVPEVISGVQLPAHIHADLLIVPDDRLRIFLHGFQYRMLHLRLGIP